MEYHAICPPSEIVPLWSGSDRRHTRSDKYLSNVVLRARSRPAVFLASPLPHNQGWRVFCFCPMRARASPATPRRPPPRFSAPSATVFLGYRILCNVYNYSPHPRCVFSQPAFGLQPPVVFRGRRLKIRIGVYGLHLHVAVYIYR